MAHSEQEAIDHIVTVLETTPRHQWRKTITRLAREVEADFTKDINHQVTLRLIQTNESFEEALNQMLHETRLVFDKDTNSERLAFEETLVGHRFSEKMVKYFMELSIEENKQVEKKLRSKSMLMQHQHITDIREGFKRLYKEKWLPAKAVDAFISSVLEMKHGGEIGPHLKKYVTELEKMVGQIAGGMQKHVLELREKMKMTEKHVQELRENIKIAKKEEDDRPPTQATP